MLETSVISLYVPTAYEETCQSLGVNLLPITLSQELSSNAYQACGPILQMLAAAGTTVAILTL